MENETLWWEAIYKENQEAKTEIYYDEVVFYERVIYLVNNVDIHTQITSGSTPF
jgi:hypothetical protein